MDTLHTEFTQRSNGPVRTVKNLYDSFAYDSDFPSDNNDDVGHGTHVAGTCECAWRRNAGVGASIGVLVGVGVRRFSSFVRPSLPSTHIDTDIHALIHSLLSLTHTNSHPVIYAHYYQTQTHLPTHLPTIISLP